MFADADSRRRLLARLARSKASPTSSNETALMSTPLPNAMIIPSVRAPTPQRRVKAPPAISVAAAAKPQANAAIIVPG
jgi:hypothetical protein